MQAALSVRPDLNAKLREYSPLVHRMARRMMTKLPANVEFDDLVQAGLLGLNEVLSRFDEAQGAQFEAYAGQRIRGAMLDELRSADWATRSSRRQQRAVAGAVQQLEHELGRAPQDAEVAQRLEMPLAEYHELLTEAHGSQMLSLEDLGAEDSGDYLDRHLADEQGDPLSMLREQRLRADLAEAIEALPERERYAMSMYYEHECSLKEIAAVLGVTDSRVCQLHRQAINRLRKVLSDW
ncbi:RNA polymerase sigma factor FliA [Caldimonas tepidiphila]|uniref:RNA polymerase sigma factor FliA n=1 Tax=Caldimonas tepidiphila TaxID=2315841 RepID=UPI000E5BAB1F|nr:RNA polymerase sigma factor FliA [Caldimonas tepidiphila]